MSFFSPIVDLRQMKQPLKSQDNITIKKASHPRYKIVSRYRAYHGNSMGSLAATGQAERKYRYEPLAPGFIHVTPPDSYRNNEDHYTVCLLN